MIKKKKKTLPFRLIGSSSQNLYVVAFPVRRGNCCPRNLWLMQNQIRNGFIQLLTNALQVLKMKEETKFIIHFKYMGGVQEKNFHFIEIAFSFNFFWGGTSYGEVNMALNTCISLLLFFLAYIYKGTSKQLSLSRIQDEKQLINSS